MLNLAKTLLSCAVLILLVGCGGPVWQFPGGALSGVEQSLAGVIIPPDGGVLQLETDPSDPYSVNLGYRNINGGLYIDPAPERGWYQRIKSNPSVRVRFDGEATVYPASAVVVSDAEILAEFEEDRIVLLLTPR